MDRETPAELRVIRGANLGTHRLQVVDLLGGPKSVEQGERDTGRCDNSNLVPCE
jgi:hypothetical protein